MSNTTSQVEALFVAAIELDGEARKAFLDHACAGQKDLRTQLEGLLQAHDRINHPIDRPAVQYNKLDETCLADNKATGTIIAGRFKLLEEIGDGGMGSVWMAEQKEPIKRLVAVKVIKAGMDSKAVLARFEAERQALALMDHPNIAKVYDAGTDDQGRPYFAMELVKGLPLTEYCDTRKLSVNDRLKLFVQICSAVQHAHQKAIIHRDLKPTNVLVTEHDGKPVPKVIDFGLAKALGGASTLTDRTLHTAYGTVVGTPLYMAPEQVGINALDVDTRTDIYALGVILYELLTGSTPLQKAQFKEAAWEEMKRLIREVEPPRPSTRLSSAATLPSLAASRQIELAQLSRLVRGELDWIVMKSLEKERTRRYETATGLAKDVQRYLDGEAVEACPPTLGYRLRKAYRRHRAAIVTLSAFAAVLLVATGLSVTFAIEARKAERKATDEAEVSSFMIDVFLGRGDLLNDSFAVGNVRFEAVLDRAVKHLDRDKQRSPLTVARIRGRIGQTYARLGRRTKAIAQLEPALAVLKQELGPNAPETLDVQEELALSHDSFDPTAMALLKDVLERRRQSQGKSHVQTIQTLLAVGRMSYLRLDMKDAGALYHRALCLAVSEHGNDSKIAIRCKLVLASHLARISEHQETVRLTKEALASAERILAKDDPNLLSIKRYATIYEEPRGGLPEQNRQQAEKEEKLLPEFIDAFGEDHPRTLIVLDDIALQYNYAGCYAQADKFSRELLAKRPPEEDTYAANRAMWIRGTTLLGLGQVAEAKSLFAEAIKILGDEGRGMAKGTALTGLGECLLQEGNYEEAEARLSEGYREMRSFFPGERMSPDRRNHIVRILTELIEVSDKLNKPDEKKKWQDELENLPQ